MPCVCYLATVISLVPYLLLCIEAQIRRDSCTAFSDPNPVRAVCTWNLPWHLVGVSGRHGTVIICDSCSS